MFEADFLRDRGRRQPQGPRDEFDSRNRWNVHGASR